MAIAFDAATDGGLVNPGTSLTWSHTVTGSNPELWVANFGDLVTNDATGAKVTGVTYNAVAMTLVAKIAEGNGANPASDRWAYLWHLEGPATGAHNVVVSASASIAIGGASVSYAGAAQTGQPDNSTTNSATAVSTLATSVTTVADNCWLVLVAKHTLATPTAGTGATVRVSSTSGITLFDSNAAITPPASSSMTVNTASAGDFAVIMASLKPDTGGASVTYPQLERGVRGVARGVVMGGY